MNILIAGGSGLIGQALLGELVDADNTIWVTTREHLVDPRYEANIDYGHIKYTFNCENYNFLNVFKDKKIDILYWCCAEVGGAKSIINNPTELLMYNLHVTSKAFNDFVNLGVKRIVFISSSYMYPDTGYPNKEEEGFLLDPPRIHYGLGWVKRYLETLCTHFSYISNTKFSIIRPTNIYGEWDNYNLETCHFIPALIRKIAEKQDPLEIWGDGSEVRNFTYVKDLARALRFVAEYEINTPMNFCPFKSHSVREAVGIILQIADYQPEVIYNKDKPSVIKYKVSDPYKLSKMGIEVEYSLKEGLENTLMWFRNTDKSLIRL